MWITCLGIAMLLWGLIRLSDPYVTEIPVSLTYLNLPEDMLPTTPLVEELQTTVKGSGFRLLLLNLGFTEKVLSLDYKYYDRYNTLSNELIKPSLSDQLSPEFSLLEVYPMELPLRFDEKASKKIPLLLKSDISYTTQYFPSGGATLSPDSVILSGPKDIVDSIEVWYTSELILEDVAETANGAIAIDTPSTSNLEISHRQAQYDIPVELYSEKEISVPVKLTNVPRGSDIIIYPKKVSVYFLVGRTNYDRVGSNAFLVTANMSDVDVKNDKYVPIKLQSHPDHIINPRIEPRSAEFIIYKK